MKLSPRVWLLAALFLLALAGFRAEGLLGQVGTYVWLGVFPGMALARLLLPRGSAATRWTIGLLVSPLVSAVVAWLLVRAGQDLLTSSRLVGMGGWLLFAGGEARTIGAESDDEDEAPWTPFIGIWMAAALLFVSLPPAFNPYVLIRSDTWYHGAIVHEIAHHGFPPIDPRFAGILLNYVWIFHLFIAQLGSFRGQDPFVFMAIFNVVAMGVLMSLAWQFAWSMWGNERAARGSVVLLTLGLNAGAWMLWPLRLLRGLTGEVRGGAELPRILSTVRIDSTDVLYQLQAPFAHMVNFWDKYTMGGPLGGGYLYVLLHWWALARWIRSSNWRWLAVAFVAGAGGVLLHSVVALSVVPVTTGALVCTVLARKRWPWLLPAGPLAAFWAATAAGFACCMPYLIGIASGWSAGKSGMQHHVIQPGWQMPWTVLTACAVTAWFAWSGVRVAIAEKRPLATWLALWCFGLVVFACIVHLPEGNEHKFVWEISAALAMLGGAAFLPALERLRARMGMPALATAFALVFLLPPAMMLRGYLIDPMRTQSPAMAPAPGENAMYEFIRLQTDKSVVVIDALARDLVMVRGERKLLAGTVFDTERGGFPAADLAERRKLSADLYGPVANPAADVAYLSEVVRNARALHEITGFYILYRGQDYTSGDTPWLRLEASGLARKAYDRDGFRLYELAVPGL